MTKQFDLEGLSNSWQQLSPSQDLDIEKIKAQSLACRTKLLAVTALELLVLFGVVIALLGNLQSGGPMHINAWLLFGLLVGVGIFIPTVRSRRQTLSVIGQSTTQWIEFQKNYSEQVLVRVKLTKYLVSIFFLALVASLIYEVFVSVKFSENFLLRHAIGFAWLSVAWLIAAYQHKKHAAFLTRMNFQ